MLRSTKPRISLWKFNLIWRLSFFLELSLFRMLCRTSMQTMTNGKTDQLPNISLSFHMCCCSAYSILTVFVVVMEYQVCPLVKPVTDYKFIRPSLMNCGGNMSPYLVEKNFSAFLLMVPFQQIYSIFRLSWSSQNQTRAYSSLQALQPVQFCDWERFWILWYFMGRPQRGK